MKRLAEHQKRTQAEITNTPHPRDQQTLATEAQYLKLLTHLKSGLIELSPDSKRRIIHAHVHQVVAPPRLGYFISSLHARRKRSLPYKN